MLCPQIRRVTQAPPRTVCFAGNWSEFRRALLVWKESADELSERCGSPTRQAPQLAPAKKTENNV